MVKPVTEDQLQAWAEKLDRLPLICPGWLYSAVRHGARNMDFDVGEGFNMPDRQSGEDMAFLLNDMPLLVAEIRRLNKLLEQRVENNMEWQTRDSAPKDGSWIIACVADDLARFIGCPAEIVKYDSSGVDYPWVDYRGNYSRNSSFTYWMPLRSPPKDQSS